MSFPSSFGRDSSLSDDMAVCDASDLEGGYAALAHEEGPFEHQSSGSALDPVYNFVWYFAAAAPLVSDHRCAHLLPNALPHGLHSHWEPALHLHLRPAP